MIETQRLEVRRFTSDDWKDLYEYLSDPKVVFYEPYEVFKEDECKSEAIRRSKDDAFWAVCLKENKKLIGNIYLSKQDFDTWELGYVFNYNYQGNGYASESARAVVNYAIKQFKARRIIAMCNPDNEKSWRLLERLNMRREGYLKKNIYFKTDDNNRPIWQDTYEYGILSSEWINFSK
jgi:[ribosomal protein S5]-alanine N-acetyltransferase